MAVHRFQSASNALDLGSLAERLSAIAEQQGSRLLTARPPQTLDLAADFFADTQTLRRRCADILASLPPI